MCRAHSETNNNHRKKINKTSSHTPNNKTCGIIVLAQGHSYLGRYVVARGDDSYACLCGGVGVALMLPRPRPSAPRLRLVAVSHLAAFRSRGHLPTVEGPESWALTRVYSSPSRCLFWFVPAACCCFCFGRRTVGGVHSWKTFLRT